MTSNSMQIVAVVFGNMKNGNYDITWGEKPYFYIDTNDMKEGDLGIVYVNSDRGFGIVRCVRSSVHEAAAIHVTKAILAKFDYDPDAFRNINTKIDEFKSKTTDHRTQLEIDKRIEEAGGPEMSEARRRLADSVDRLATGPVVGKRPGYIGEYKYKEQDDLDEEIPF